MTHLHRQAFLAQIQNHPTAHAIKTGERWRVHHLPQTSPPLRNEFLPEFHCLLKDERWLRCGTLDPAFPARPNACTS
jgi:hypothetical protein